MLPQACIQIKEAMTILPLLSHIASQGDYEAALKLMDELMEDYDDNRSLIQLLSLSIGEWEQSSEEFSDFNREIENIDTGVALLKTLMEQYGIGLSGLPEVGSKANVSKLLNGVNGKKLTRAHIEALSKRFDISPALFF